MKKPLPKNVDVILPLALDGTYTYSVPCDTDMPQPGMRVLVPLLKKEVVGIVLRQSEKSEKDINEAKIRPIITVLDSQPAVTTAQLRLWQWISDYYLCPLGDTLAAALPHKLLDRQYSLDSTTRRVRMPEYKGDVHAAKPLTGLQNKALQNIRRQWEEKLTVLLYGVTSSGKTEIYVHLAKQFLEQGKDVLYLVPEIALTAQLTERLQYIFGNHLLVYHSRVTDAQRAETYRRILNARDDGGKLIIGARSAAFMPFRDLGLVIVDEEHEPNYKQTEPAPRYNARSAAVMLAQMTGAKVLLGTATPSVETRFNAEQGKYGMVTMKERYSGLQMPVITMIDLQRQYHRKEMYGHFADQLVARIREELAKNKQVIVFQNRRGYAPFVQCVQCGRVEKCPQCDVPLTLHNSIRQRLLCCHYCNYNRPMPDLCPTCGKELKIHGFGTERIEDEAAKLFPEARILRMDLDSTRRKDAYSDIIRRFSAHEADILIGTQMVTKGLHFDNVSLVCVLQADNLLNHPSFRGYERAYQLLEQVAGRAGRKEGRGEVLIQTFDPQHPVFNFLQDHDTEGFYRWQLDERRQFNYPPFCRMTTLTLRHKDEERVQHAAMLLQQNLVQIFGNRCSAIIIPSTPHINGLFVRQIQLKIETAASSSLARHLILECTSKILSNPACKSVRLVPDTDPL